MKQPTNISNSSQVRSKGCSNRLKFGKKKCNFKLRVYRGSRLQRQAHNKRSCPKLNENNSCYYLFIYLH